MGPFTFIFGALILGSFAGRQPVSDLTLCLITFYYNLRDDLTRRVLISPLPPVRESSCAAPCSELTSCASCVESALKCTWCSANVRVMGSSVAYRCMTE